MSAIDHEANEKTYKRLDNGLREAAGDVKRHTDEMLERLGYMLDGEREPDDVARIDEEARMAVSDLDMYLAAIGEIRLEAEPRQRTSCQRLLASTDAMGWSSWRFDGPIPAGAQAWHAERLVVRATDSGWLARAERHGQVERAAHHVILRDALADALLMLTDEKRATLIAVEALILDDADAYTLPTEATANAD